MEKIWYGRYDAGVPKTVMVLPSAHTEEYFENNAKSFPERAALFYFGRRISYKELAEAVSRCASLFASKGIERGDRVALHLPNVPQFVIVYLATLKIGAIAVPINPTYPPEELLHILKDSGAKALVTLTKFLGDVESVFPQTAVKHLFVTNVKDWLPLGKKILFTLFKEKKDGHRKTLPKYAENFSKAVSRRKPFASRRFWLTAVILYTGGTTGRPKGVTLRHFQIVSNSRQVRSWMPGFENGKEAIAAVLPFFHAYGFSNLNTALLSGSSSVLFPEPNLAELLKAFPAHKITIMPGVPLLYERILADPQTPKTDFSSLKFCISGAAALKLDTRKAFEERTGAKLVNGYGLTEASPVTHAEPLNGIRKEGSIGLPIPSTDVKVLNEDGRECAPYEKGEIVISGPQIMQGYWNDPSATKRVIRNGWLYTGDIGYYDEEGYFFIVDRIKDMIIVKGSGLKVYPSEVEDVLRTHPMVQEVVVAGVKDEKGEEVPAAYVVLKEEAKVDEARAVRDIKTFASRHLADYKNPRIIKIVDEIPKNIIGKPLRRLLTND